MQGTRDTSTLLSHLSQPPQPTAHAANLSDPADPTIPDQERRHRTIAWPTALRAASSGVVLGRRELAHSSGTSEASAHERPEFSAREANKNASYCTSSCCPFSQPYNLWLGKWRSIVTAGSTLSVVPPTGNLGCVCACDSRLVGRQPEETARKSQQREVLFHATSRPASQPASQPPRQPISHSYLVIRALHERNASARNFCDLYPDSFGAVQPEQLPHMACATSVQDLFPSSPDPSRLSRTLSTQTMDEVDLPAAVRRSETPPTRSVQHADSKRAAKVRQMNASIAGRLFGRLALG
ncbi:hypothetical protein F5Y15DRAFT_73481 [Xylariaceae sp. FL0016]|nr:hypothetical protein F5Y15DRAFT_73481 [Xylariaceae sp. FL0016]